MRTKLRAPKMIDPLDPSIERHTVKEGEVAISFIWLGFYGMILCTVLLSKFGDKITDVIALAGLN
jgi:hypothetical protein